MLSAIISDIGSENFLRMLRSGYIRGSYVRDQPGIHSQGGHYMMTQMRQAGVADKPGAKFDLEDELVIILERAGEKRKVAKSVARQLLKFLPLTRLNDGSATSIDFPIEFANDIRLRKDYLLQARMVLDAFLPGATSTRIARFKLHEDIKDKFVIDSDADWAAIKVDADRLYGSALDLTPAQVLVQIQSGFIDLGLAARFGTEMLTTDLHQQLVASRVHQLVQARSRNEEQIRDFSQIYLGDSFALRDHINIKGHSFKEFLTLMDKSRKFKEMLRNANPDVGLVRAYAEEVKKDTWLDKLAPKSIRFGVVALGGATLDAILPTGLGTAAGVGLGAFDTFVLDRIVRGWRPNTFIEDDLRDFLNSSGKPPTNGTLT
jgi:hypothetical protein